MKIELSEDETVLLCSGLLVLEQVLKEKIEKGGNTRGFTGPNLEVGLGKVENLRVKIQREYEDVPRIIL